MKDKSFLSMIKKNIMTVILVLVYLFFVVLTKGGIFKPASFSELINQNAYVYILGVGMLMCMLTGGNVDLSCGSFVCLLGALGGLFMVIKGMNVALSIVLILVIGVIYGLILGYLIAYVHIPPWIATLAGYLSFRGLGTSILSSNSTTGSIAAFPKSFENIFYGRIFSTTPGVFNWVCFICGIVAAVLVVLLAMSNRKTRIRKGYEVEALKLTVVKCVLECGVIILLMSRLAMNGGIPTALVWVLAIVLLYSFITSKTTIGRHFYVVGGNIETARLSGVNTRRIMLLAYLNMAVLTSITAMCVISRSDSAYADIGKNFEMDAISACVVGGVSATGGAGSVFGMVVGATLIGVINLGMSLISMDMDWQRVVKGFVLLAAVVFDILSKKHEN